jgi:hypothetical protein
MAANIAAQAGTVNLQCTKHWALLPAMLAGRADELLEKRAQRLRDRVLSPTEIIEWRRRPELNRRTRFCRPLRNHSATTPSRRKIGNESPALKRKTPKVFLQGLLQSLEREKGLEPSTSTLARLRSTN